MRNIFHVYMVNFNTFFTMGYTKFSEKFSDYNIKKSI